MSSEHSGRNFLHLLSTLLIAGLKIIGYLVGWSSKCVGWLFSKTGELILKLSEK